MAVWAEWVDMEAWVDTKEEAMEDIKEAKEDSNEMNRNQHDSIHSILLLLL